MPSESNKQWDIKARSEYYLISTILHCMMMMDKTLPDSNVNVGPVRGKSNSCIACARSKRKCDRRTPSCGRCLSSNKTCVYSSSNLRIDVSSQFRHLRSLSSRPQVDVLADSAFTSSSIGDLLTQYDAIQHLEPPFVDSGHNVIAGFLTPRQISGTYIAGIDWFLMPETWVVSHRGAISNGMRVPIDVLKEYNTIIQSWLERWVNSGACPMIHSHLYKGKFPSCVQAAYTTLTSYIHRTPENTDIVLRIIQDRVNELVQENHKVNGGKSDTSLFEKLSNLHALIIYQVIGLLDGDIRARHVAEGHIGVQSDWAGVLFDSAGKILSNSEDLINHLSDYLPRSSASSQQRWYLWILSETIRRTWLVANTISGVFTALQQRWSICPGDIMFTNRRGLWDAASATEWELQWFINDPIFLKHSESMALLDDWRPEDIDEFGTTLLHISFQQETLEQWRNQSIGL